MAQRKDVWHVKGPPGRGLWSVMMTISRESSLRSRPASALVLVSTLGLLAACDLGSKSVGDPSGDTTGPVDEPDASDGGTFDPTDADSASSVGGTDSTTGATTEDPSGAGTEPDATDTDGGASVCQEFTPPPFGCPELGGSTAVVALNGDTEQVPEQDVCMVTALGDGAVDQQVLLLSCSGSALGVDITTSAPHLELPLAVGQVVEVAVVQGEIDGALLELVVRPDGGGAPIFAWMAARGQDDITPAALGEFSFSKNPTGCFGTVAVEAACPGDQILLLQSVTVAVTTADASVELANQSYDVLQLGGQQYDVMTGRNQRIACWDDGCGIEVLPDTFEMLLVQAP